MQLSNRSLLILISSFLSTSCSGDLSNSSTLINNDYVEQGSCKVIKGQMKAIQNQIQAFIPNSDKAGRSEVLGNSGAVLIMPIPFVNLNQQDRVKVGLLQDEYQKLSVEVINMGCK